jgi:hypothetical protein
MHFWVRKGALRVRKAAHKGKIDGLRIVSA